MIDRRVEPEGAVGGLALEPKFVAGDGTRIIGRRRSRRRARGNDVRATGTIALGDPRIERRLVSELDLRSEEHTSELQSLMRISYAVFCLKKQNIHTSI